MTEHDHTLIAEDGRDLAATVYEPETWRGSAAMLGAWGVPRRYYRHFAAFLAERGYRVLTFDCRGIGDSLRGHPRDEPATTTDWARLDHGAAIDWLANEPGPSLAVGHSFGGQLAGVTDKARSIHAMYAVGAQLGYYGHWDGVRRHTMHLAFSVAMPLTTRVFGYLPSWTGIGEDIPPGAIREWARWLRSPNYLVDHVPGAAERFATWPGHIVLNGFTDDTYAPPRGVKALAECYATDHRTVRIRAPEDVGLTEVGHFGYFRPTCREPLWHECADQLDAWSQSPPVQ